MASGKKKLSGVLVADPQPPKRKAMMRPIAAAPSASRFTNRLRSEALRLGFADMGIAPARLSAKVSERLHQWLDDGCHGDMLWMENRSNERAQPQTLWPDVQSVIMLGMSYAPDHDPRDRLAHRDNGLISVYAQGGDYHKHVKKSLKALARWIIEECARNSADDAAQLKVFVDTAPVMEKALAEAAGLGWQGKHTNMVSCSHGSWLFLGAIYTSLDLPASGSGHQSCGSCSACLDVCPTKAFPEPYRLDARRCISYLTIEHNGPIAHEFRTAMGNHVYGCDDCLSACPWNKFADAGQRNRAFLPRAEFVSPDLDALLSLDKESFAAVFAGSSIKRSGRDRIVRNACIAAGNSGNTRFVGPLAELTRDDSAIVRGAAIWGLWQLDPDHAANLRQELERHENDPAVQYEWRRECPA